MSIPLFQARSSVTVRLASIGLFALLALPALALPPASRESDSRYPNKEKTDSDRKIDPGAVEVRFTDNSTMKLSLKDDKIEYLTAYGKLMIPIRDIRRIELATRIPDDIAKKVDSAIFQLANTNYRARMTAAQDLCGFKEKAYPALLRAAQHTDPEVVARAEEILTKIRAEVAEEQLEIRAEDVLYTETSKISGRIDAASFKVATFQFGELQLKLTDIRSIRSLAVAEPEADAKNIETGPVNLVNYQNNFNKTYIFRVTGSLQGSIWGIDQYSTDSTLSMAAVHAGILQPGQTGLVKVTIIQPPPAFAGSTRNGVTSSPFAQYPAAFRMHK